MHTYKFESFYYEVDMKEHKLSMLEKVNDEQYKKDFKGKIYCPCCKKAKLLLAHRNGKIFLRTFVNYKHDKSCLFESEETSNKIVAEYIKGERSVTRISSMLDAAIRAMIPKDDADRESRSSVIPKENDVSLGNKVADNVKIRNAIPHRSLYRWDKQKDNHLLTVFYGKVKIKNRKHIVKQKNGERKEISFLDLYKLNTNNLIVSIFKPNDFDIADGNYYLSLFGTCTLKSCGKKCFKNLRLHNPTRDSIKVKKLP